MLPDTASDTITFTPVFADPLCVPSSERPKHTEIDAEAIGQQYLGVQNGESMTYGAWCQSHVPLSGSDHGAGILQRINGGYEFLDSGLPEAQREAAVMNVWDCCISERMWSVQMQSENKTSSVRGNIKDEASRYSLVVVCRLVVVDHLVCYLFPCSSSA